MARRQVRTRGQPYLEKASIQQEATVETVAVRLVQHDDGEVDVLVGGRIREEEREGERCLRHWGMRPCSVGPWTHAPRRLLLVSPGPQGNGACAAQTPAAQHRQAERGRAAAGEMRAGEPAVPSCAYREPENSIHDVQRAGASRAEPPPARATAAAAAARQSPAAADAPPLARSAQHWACRPAGCESAP